jgi:hypothetical protein
MGCLPLTCSTVSAHHSHATMVRTITLNDGKKIPALAWGNTQKTSHVGADVLKAGIAHVDTAQVMSPLLAIIRRCR